MGKTHTMEQGNRYHKFKMLSTNCKVRYLSSPIVLALIAVDRLCSGPFRSPVIATTFPGMFEFAINRFKIRYIRNRLIKKNIIIFHPTT